MAETTVSEKHGKSVEFLIKIPGSQWFLGTIDKLQMKKIINFLGEPQTLRSVNNMTTIDWHLFSPQSFLLFFGIKADGEEETPLSV